MIQGEKWVVYYTNGDQFTSEDGTPWDAPRRSIQAIASSSPEVGFYWIYGSDYFYYEEESGGWQKADTFTLWDHLVRAKYPCPGFGRMLSDQGWRDMWKRIREDFGKKDGWLQRENDVRQEAEKHQ